MAPKRFHQVHPPNGVRSQRRSPTAPEPGHLPPNARPIPHSRGGDAIHRTCAAWFPSLRSSWWRLAR
jgi:hypothetical protein